MWLFYPGRLSNKEWMKSAAIGATAGGVATAYLSSGGLLAGLAMGVPVTIAAIATTGIIYRIYKNIRPISINEIYSTIEKHNEEPGEFEDLDLRENFQHNLANPISEVLEPEAEVDEDELDGLFTDLSDTFVESYASTKSKTGTFSEIPVEYKLEEINEPVASYEVGGYSLRPRKNNEQ